MRKPNIIVIQSDDHGRWANGCYGNSEVHSPSIDEIARSGALFSRAMTPSPVCSPARASFWTGHLPSTHGIHDYIEESGVGKNHPGLRGQKTLASYLSDAGYQTGLVGKWHCNHPDEKPPGFDYWFAGSRGTSANFKKQFFHDGHAEHEFFGRQATIITDHAKEFLRQTQENTEQPFFLYLGYTDTHTPHRNAPPRLVNHYRNATFCDIPDETASPAHGAVRLKASDDADEVRAWQADYYASVSMIDEQVGAILDQLDNYHIRDETLIVYTSDHGHMNNHHGLWTKGNATIPQNVIDESIMVPLVMSWPANISAGQTHATMVDHCDLMTTLLDVAQAPGYSGPGLSFLPLLKEENHKAKDIQFGEYGNARFARSDDWKLIRRFVGENGHFADQLFDLRNDPRERCNVIDKPEHMDLVRKLSQRIDEHFERWQTEAHRGDRISQQHPHNTWQPWTVSVEEMRQRQGPI